MKRRTFSMLGAVSMLALKSGMAKAQSSKDPSLLTTTLTPMGSERAGNADGSIPAWTGGATTPPAGWQPGQFMPDLFAGEASLLTIDASNMAQYDSLLNDGVKALMTKYGFSLKVYPTHRTAAAPQWVYDNIAKNLVNAQLDPAGGRWGFSGAFGGVPFPIPDTDPANAGAQIIWNHECRWQGENYYINSQGWVRNQGGAPVLAQTNQNWFDIPYYRHNGSLATYNGMLDHLLAKLNGPPNDDGVEIVQEQFSDPAKNHDNLWELLNGQGRVRRAPELDYDTPSAYADGESAYDEYYAYTGSLQEYDWKLLEKKEMYIPYNNNGLTAVPATTAMLPHFLDPDLIRWEKHRVWVVECTLHPGERNVLARRRFYVDEDTWIIHLLDAWDANDNLYHVQQTYNIVRPDLPGTLFMNYIIWNLETDGYVIPSSIFDEQAHPSLKFNLDISQSLFDPQNMAASGQF